LKNDAPVDYVKHGAVSLPIRQDPVKGRVLDPTAPQVEGQPPKYIEKIYESFYVDARNAGRGRIRASSIAEAKEKGAPLAKEIAKEGEAAIVLTPEERRIYVIAKNALAPFGIAVDEGARQLAEILKQLNGEPFSKILYTFKALDQKLKIGAKVPEVYKHYLQEQEVVRGNSEYHVRDVKRYLAKYFVKAFPGEIIPITTDQIDAWLKTLGGKKCNTKNNARDHVIAFFNFAQKKDYLVKGREHAALGTTPYKDARKTISTEAEATESSIRSELQVWMCMRPTGSCRCRGLSI